MVIERDAPVSMGPAGQSLSVGLPAGRITCRSRLSRQAG